MGNKRGYFNYFEKVTGLLLICSMCLLLFLTKGTSVNATEVSTESGLPSSGEVTLTGDVTLSKAWEISGTVILDLNGHTLKRDLSTRSWSMLPAIEILM